MKILLVDQLHGFLDFALRAEAQGHEVRVALSPLDRLRSQYPSGRSNIGRGLVKLVEDWRAHVRWADLIVASDNCRYTKELDSLRSRGFPIFACTDACAQWELKRDEGQQILEAAGIECLPSVRFTNYDAAIAYQLKHRDVRFVCKPCADVDKSLSYVSKSFKDMIFMLGHWKRTIPKPAPFIFQEFCPGIEVAVGGWVGRNGFLGHFLENFEFKKLMNGEKGPNTGEMGTVMKYVTAEESLLVRELLLPLEMELVRQNYSGYIDVAVMMGTEGPRKGKLNPLEFTCRHGWPLFNIQQILHPDVAGWMLDAVEGRDTFAPLPDIALGVVVGMPDFPDHRIPQPQLEGFPIWGINEGTRYFMHPMDMMLGKGLDDSGKLQPMMVTAGNNPLIVTGRGKSVQLAKRAAYGHLAELEIPNSPMFRTDIGDRIESQLPLLQRHGYMTSWIY